MIRRPPRSTLDRSSAASDVYKRQELGKVEITRFIDNECRVFIDEDVSGQDVVIIQSLSLIHISEPTRPY